MLRADKLGGAHKVCAVLPKEPPKYFPVRNFSFSAAPTTMPVQSATVFFSPTSTSPMNSKIRAETVVFLSPPIDCNVPSSLLILIGLRLVRIFHGKKHDVAQLLGGTSQTYVLAFSMCFTAGLVSATEVPSGWSVACSALQVGVKCDLAFVVAYELRCDCSP